eukprot:15007844-Heterocapsa_arctica.AAC.1
MPFDAALHADVHIAHEILEAVRRPHGGEGPPYDLPGGAVERFSEIDEQHGQAVIEGRVAVHRRGVPDLLKHTSDSERAICTAPSLPEPDLRIVTAGFKGVPEHTVSKASDHL